MCELSKLECTVNAHPEARRHPLQQNAVGWRPYKHIVFANGIRSHAIYFGVGPVGVVVACANSTIEPRWSLALSISLYLSALCWLHFSTLLRFGVCVLRLCRCRCAACCLLLSTRIIFGPQSRRDAAPPRRVRMHARNGVFDRVMRGSHGRHGTSTRVSVVVKACESS